MRFSLFLIVFSCFLNQNITAQCVFDTHYALKRDFVLSDYQFGGNTFKSTEDRFVFDVQNDVYTVDINSSSTSVDWLTFSVNGSAYFNSPQLLTVNNGMTLNLRGKLKDDITCSGIQVNVELKKNGSIVCTDYILLVSNICPSHFSRWTQKDIVAYRLSPDLEVSGGIFHIGGDQEFYIVEYDDANLGTQNSMYNTYGNSLFTHEFAQDFFGNRQPVRQSTNIEHENGLIYVVGADNKIYYTFWDPQDRYVYYLINGNLNVRSDSHIEAGTDGKVFYIDDEGNLSNVFGSTWQHGPLNVNAPKAAENSDFVKGDYNNLFYVDALYRIVEMKWDGASWSWLPTVLPGIPTTSPGTEMTYDNGRLFYVGSDKKIHILDGPAHIHSTLGSAPLAESSNNRTGLDAKGDALVYVSDNRDLIRFELDQHGNWSQDFRMPSCTRVAMGSDIDYSNYAERIYYKNGIDYELHYISLSSCAEEMHGKTDPEEPIIEIDEERFKTQTHIAENENHTKESFYPNPVESSYGSLNFSLNGSFSYELYNVNQKLIKEGNMENSKVNIEGLRRGLYIIKWKDLNTNSKGSSKIVVY